MSWPARLKRASRGKIYFFTKQNQGCSQMFLASQELFSIQTRTKSKMKKQINPSIKAHLIRGAFYLLLLLAVCAIPFALAQRSAIKRPVARSVTVLPRTVMPRLLSASQVRSPVLPRVHRLLRTLLPNAVYMIDDGTAEDAVGLTNGGDIICLNTFAVIPGSETIAHIIIAWGTPVFPDPSLNGLPYTVALWSDPNGDGSPTDAVLLTTASGVVANQGTDTFIDTAITPTTITTANFFVGFVITHVTGQFPAAFDETPPTFSNTSWVAGSNTAGGGNIMNLNDNDIPVSTIESNGLVGNWLIRADTGGGVSPTPTATASPTPTATTTPSACSWSGGPDLPQAGTRLVGVFFPANGKFYAMGGRDVNNVEFTNPFEFDPASKTWTTKSATYPDASTNNMACSVLNDSGTDYIYCAGGSNFAAQTTSGRVFRYDPIADSITTVAANWPPGDTGILPGGFSVFNNTFVILGGFDIPNGVGTDEIWQFTPSPAGWVQKNAHLPVPLGYIPTTTIGSLIYTGGGADITGGALTDTTNSFVYDPVADSINTIATIPRPTSNTRAVNFCNQMYVLGGAFNAPSNEVDIYDPVSNTWSLGAPFPTAGRNFAADTDGTNNIWKAGGYAEDGATIIATTEIFNCPVSPCASASPTPTATATATPTPTATPEPRSTPTPRPRPTAPAPRP
jgi:N-acetylneuraminic acid mutarotase